MVGDPFVRRAVVAFFSLALVGGTFANFSWAADSPDLEVNPVTGLIELVDVAPNEGDRVRHVEDPGQGGERVDSLVSSNAAAGSRIAIKLTGESWAVWQDTETEEIRYAFRDPVTKAWSAEAILSNSGEMCRHPSIVHNGTETWIAYEVQDGSVTSIAATGIIDSPEPFPTSSVVGTTSLAGTPEVRLHSESGQVWVTWVHSATDVGWSEYDHATNLWSAPQFEPYDRSTADDARQAVRNRVLGQ